MRIRYSPKFLRQYKKLPRDIQLEAEKKEEIFRNDPFDSRLKTHKLHGSDEGFFSFRVTYSHRIIFSIEKDDIVLYEIGDHNIYD